MGSCLKRKEALKPPTHRKALLALLPGLQLALREGEDERGRGRERERRRVVIVISTRISNPISQLSFVIEV